MAAKRTEKVEVEESTDSLVRRTLIVLSVGVAFGFGLWFLYQVRAILLLIFIAIVFALALNPAVAWLTRHRFSRGWASLVAVLLSLTVVLSLLAAVAAPLVSQTTKLVDNAPQIIDDISHNEDVRKFEDKYHIRQKVEEAVSKAPTFFSGSQSEVVGTIKSTFGAIANVAIIITLTVFLLIEGPAAWKLLVRSQSRAHAARIDRVGRNISKGVGGYVTGNLFISLIAGTVGGVTMALLGVPYAFPLAVFLAIFDLIPLVGATLATVVLCLVALTQGFVPALVVLIVMVIYQNVEGHIIQPLVYARTVQLSPLFILIATITGAHLGGIIGVLLAIPTASIAQILFIDLLKDTTAGRRAHLKEST